VILESRKAIAFEPIKNGSLAIQGINNAEIFYIIGNWRPIILGWAQNLDLLKIKKKIWNGKKNFCFPTPIFENIN
jgi:hypothetical protein